MRFSSGQPLSHEDLNAMLRDGGGRPGAGTLSRESSAGRSLVLDWPSKKAFFHAFKIYRWRRPADVKPDAEDWRAISVHQGTVNLIPATGTDNKPVPALQYEGQDPAKLVIPEGQATATIIAIVKIVPTSDEDLTQWPGEPLPTDQATAKQIAVTVDPFPLDAFGLPYSPYRSIDDLDAVDKDGNTIKPFRVLGVDVAIEAPEADPNDENNPQNNGWHLTLGKVEADDERKKLTLHQCARGSVSLVPVIEKDSVEDYKLEAFYGGAGTFRILETVKPLGIELWEDSTAEIDRINELFVYFVVNHGHGAPPPGVDVGPLGVLFEHMRWGPLGPKLIVDEYGGEIPSYEFGKIRLLQPSDFGDPKWRKDGTTIPTDENSRRRINNTGASGFNAWWLELFGQIVYFYVRAGRPLWLPITPDGFNAPVYDPGVEQ